VLSFKNIEFNASLKAVELGYHGRPRVDAREVDRRVEEAYLRGREEATQAFNKQILSQRTEVQQLLGETLEVLDMKVDKCLRDVFEEIPALVTNIARRVLADVELDGAMIKAVVDDVISDLPSNKGEIQVYLSPRDLESLEAFLEGTQLQFPHCNFKSDPLLGPADCRVVSHFGAIDGRVSTKLKHIEDQLHS